MHFVTDDYFFIFMPLEKSWKMGRKYNVELDAVLKEYIR